MKQNNLFDTSSESTNIQTEVVQQQKKKFDIFFHKKFILKKQKKKTQYKLEIKVEEYFLKLIVQ